MNRNRYHDLEYSNQKNQQTKSETCYNFGEVLLKNPIQPVWTRIWGVLLALFDRK